MRPDDRDRDRGDRLAADLRGFGPLGLLAAFVIMAGNLVVVPLSAVLVLLWRNASRTPWREIGYAPPRSWGRSVALGIVFGIALKIIMKAIVMPLLGAAPINEAFHHLTGNRAALPAMLYTIVAGAGFGEETVFRGWMFERFGKLFGAGIHARALIVVLTSILFGFAHYAEQGWDGVEQAMIVGVVFGTLYARTKSIWMLMAAHAAFDLTALAVIYWDLESTVAHWVFD